MADDTKLYVTIYDHEPPVDLEAYRNARAGNYARVAGAPGSWTGIEQHRCDDPKCEVCAWNRWAKHEE